MKTEVKKEEKKDVVHKARIVVQIDEDLKDRFKMVLIYDKSNFTDKITDIIRAYTDMRMKQITKTWTDKETVDRQKNQ